MQRDMELVRKILFKIEESVDNVACNNLKIEGYSMDQVAYHCSILYEGGYIYDYKAQYGGNGLYSTGPVLELVGLHGKGMSSLIKFVKTLFGKRQKILLKTKDCL